MSWLLDWFCPPQTWESVPLGRLVSRSKESGHPDLSPLSVFLDEGVVPRSNRQDNFNRLGTDLGKYLVVRPGDLVFNKLRTWQGGLGMSSHHGIVSPAYFVCRPVQGVEPRFLHYLLRSRVYLEELTRLSKWMPPSQFDIAWDDLKKLPVSRPKLAEQRAIADFLDVETARIDALITKKRRLAEVLIERRSSLISRRLWGTTSPLVRLRHIAARPTSGNRDHSSFTFSEEGVPCLRGLNIRPGRIVTQDLLRISVEDHDRHATTALDPGDLVIVRSGLAGSAVAIPDGFGPCNCVDLVVVKGTGKLVPRYLEYVVNSREAQEQVKVRSAGALLQHFNAVDAGDLQIPWREMDQQRDVVVALDEACEVLDQLTAVLERHIHLLDERRLALITATVTGDLDLADRITEEAS